MRNTYSKPSIVDLGAIVSRTFGSATASTLENGAFPNNQSKGGATNNGSVNTTA